PSAAFLYDSHLASEVDDFAIAGDAGSIENVELRFFERGSHFVLDNFHPRAAADDIVAFFQRSDAADIHAHGGVKLERVAASGGFGVAEHDTNFHANLVDEDDHGLGTRNSRRKFPQGLRHQSSLQSHMGVAHLTFDFRFRHQRGDRVDGQDVDGAAAYQGFGDFQRLFAVVRLGDQKIVGLNAEFLGIT